LTKKKRKLELELARKRLIFPDLYHVEEQGSESNNTLHSEQLINVKSSPFPGNNILRLMEKRTKDIIATGYPLEIESNGVTGPTQMGSAQINMESMSGCLKIIYFQIENREPIDLHLFDQYSFLNTMMAYQLGGHDQSINLGDHASNGYDSNVIYPKKGGIQKAKKSESVKKLVKSMVLYIDANPNFNKPKPATLARAIHAIIQKFTNTGQNHKLKAFANFELNCPEPKTIGTWISNLNLDFNGCPSLKSPRYNKLIELFERDYPKSTIERILKKYEIQ
jgi:hypothetical protein